MLVREPSARIKLDDILRHPWMADDTMLQPMQTPLVTRKQISEDIHSHIVQKMVEGKIATKEEVQA